MKIQLLNTDEVVTEEIELHEDSEHAKQLGNNAHVFTNIIVDGRQYEPYHSPDNDGSVPQFMVCDPQPLVLR